MLQGGLPWKMVENNGQVGENSMEHDDTRVW